MVQARLENTYVPDEPTEEVADDTEAENDDFEQTESETDDLEEDLSVAIDDTENKEGREDVSDVPYQIESRDTDIDIVSDLKQKVIQFSSDRPLNFITKTSFINLFIVKLL